ncbi:hypothetical protein ABB37_05317 [Leptomonas pyrrhocoris]|uniref:Uncharacterized protein n=1 Tax=Leptomonas pyrrhocoris TaxID=157538 RepID=A0A0M9G073_LEPPY|nr:hypothetical protein ABB37_05317 [Leptomonas pyrrhocoris]XP_015657925.1 hypothetical protein ABB37_05317 [Leptomonas pyrrhocoris]KPA79485.1 hypothetical protein ABB37_05317 [Leptomonas pyrrhocoris]KPA79486.1 hypothetical protein ABB37_05317 [Leptomonas pyrrhocoris]|eukprot:XP_015657924.1 hypothetical protein ABB37_05317 [Leptomonas pyrrhocoris]
MVSEEGVHEPVEEHVENAPADETAHNADEQIDNTEAELQGDAQPELAEEQNANAVGENAAEENDGVVKEQLGGGDLSDPRVFKMAAREVDECYMSVIRGLSAFCQDDEEVFGNAVDICNDIITMEQNLFSDIPSYIADYIATYRAKTDKYNNSVQPRETIPTPEGPPRDWEERRAYVDPGVPLMLPYDAERFKKEHPERATSEGTYHDLFYGDGSKVVFEAPEDNKRKKIEEEHQKAYHPPRQAPLSFEPQKKKPMRVSADFVPSCAEVKDPQPAKRTKPVAKAQPKNVQKKSVSTQ